jgi:hypothetical protein
MRAIFTIILLAWFCGVAAQGTSEGNRFAPKHRNFAGKPCLESSGVSRSTASNSRISVHSVAIKNGCGDRIKVKLCYHGSTDCVDVDIPGYSSKETVLGVFPATQTFQYDINEQF